MTPLVDDRAEPAVRGVLHRPLDSGRDGLVLSHGAGADHDSPLLRAVAEAFAARGLTVLRCDLPFRQSRRRGPPSPRSAPRDREGLRRALEVLRARCPGRLLLGGHSYGGRQASLLVAEAPGVADGLLLLAYPLHPPGRADHARVAHFPRITTPTLFVHGTADPFGTMDELNAARRLMPAPSRVIRVEGGRHDLRVPGTAPWAFAVEAAALLLAPAV